MRALHSKHKDNYGLRALVWSGRTARMASLGQTALDESTEIAFDHGVADACEIEPSTSSAYMEAQHAV